MRVAALDRQESTPFAIARREKEPNDFLPYARHADEGTIVTDGGSLIAVVQLQGASFETLDQSDLNGMHEKINSVLRNLSDERVEWVTHTIRERSEIYPDGDFCSDFARAFDAAYRRRTAGEQGFVNELYLSIVEKPAVGAADKLAVALGRLVSRREKVDAYVDVEVERLQRFNERVAETIKLLGRFSPRRLTLYDHGGLVFSEPLEVFELILMGRRRRVPLVRGHLGSALYGDRLIFGRELGEVRAHDRSRFFGIFGIREYPAATRPGQLDALLSADYQCCITQSWAPMSRAIGADRVRKRRRQLISTDDDARSAGEALDEAADDLASNHFVMGEHHFSLAVFGNTVRELNDHLAAARSLLADAGLVAVREESANEAAWWAQLPGNARWRARPAMVTSRNFAALSPFHTYPAGKADGNHWGPAVMMFQTTALSSYYFIRADAPLVSTVLPTGERCQFLIPPATMENIVSVTMRKPSSVNLTLDDMIAGGVFDDTAVAGRTISAVDQRLLELLQAKDWGWFLRIAVRARKNILISGATGSGKTTISKALIQLIPAIRATKILYYKMGEFAGRLLPPPRIVAVAPETLQPVGWADRVPTEHGVPAAQSTPAPALTEAQLDGLEELPVDALQFDPDVDPFAAIQRGDDPEEATRRWMMASINGLGDRAPA